MRRIMRVHVLDDAGIGSVIRFQMRDKVWVGQESDIKNQIRIDRHAVLEAETHKRHQEVLRFLLLEYPNGMLPQFMNRELRCIDDLIRHRADWGKPLALDRNRLEHGPVRIDGMRPPRFAESADEYSVRRFKKP